MHRHAPPAHGFSTGESSESNDPPPLDPAETMRACLCWLGICALLYAALHLVFGLVS